MTEYVCCQCTDIPMLMSHFFLQSCDFVKKRDDTVLRVVWNGDLRLINTGPKGGSARRWFFTINGQECKDPTTIDTQLHTADRTSNVHRPAYGGWTYNGLIHIVFLFHLQHSDNWKCIPLLLFLLLLLLIVVLVVVEVEVVIVVVVVAVAIAVAVALTAVALLVSLMSNSVLILAVVTARLRKLQTLSLTCTVSLSLVPFLSHLYRFSLTCTVSLSLVPFLSH